MMVVTVRWCRRCRFWLRRGLIRLGSLGIGIICLITVIPQIDSPGHGHLVAQGWRVIDGQLKYDRNGFHCSRGPLSIQHPRRAEDNLFARGRYCHITMRFLPNLQYLIVSSCVCFFNQPAVISPRSICSTVTIITIGRTAHKVISRCCETA